MAQKQPKPQNKLGAQMAVSASAVAQTKTALEQQHHEVSDTEQLSEAQLANCKVWNMSPSKVFMLYLS